MPKLRVILILVIGKREKVATLIQKVAKIVTFIVKNICQIQCNVQHVILLRTPLQQLKHSAGLG